jgi:uncharacterized membrane protein (UPF0127 family)
MKHWRFIAGAILLVAVVGIAILFNEPGKPKPEQAKQTACGAYRNDKTVTINGSALKAEVAQTPADREKGLSGRPCIEAGQAMLFVFDKPSQYAIWMKDMHFPIDIVWINSEHKTVGLELSVEPSTYPDRFANKDQPAQYVLELQANRAKDLGVGLGTEVAF